MCALRRGARLLVWLWVCSVAVAPAPRRVPPTFTSSSAARADPLPAAKKAAGLAGHDTVEWKVCDEGEDGAQRCMYRANGFTCLLIGGWGASEEHRAAADACAWTRDWEPVSSPCWSAPPETRARGGAFAHWMPGDIVAVDFLNKAHAHSELVTACYEMAVLAAVSNPADFAEFKRDPRYTAVLEHVDPARGLEYLNHLLVGRGTSEEGLLDMGLLDRVLANDEIGHPRTAFYMHLGRFASPTTLRYLKFAFDVRKWFGSLDGMRVVEVGGGYGGLSKVFFDVWPGIASHATYDLPAVLQLVMKYHASMSTLNAPRAEGRCCEYRDGTDSAKFSTHDAGDLFISYYALTELTDEYAAHYLSAVAAKCPHGLIELERGKHDRWQRDSRLRQIEALYGPLTVVPERPSTGDNVFVGWGLMHAARQEL